MSMACHMIALFPTASIGIKTNIATFLSCVKMYGNFTGVRSVRSAGQTLEYERRGSLVLGPYVATQAIFLNTGCTIDHCTHSTEQLRDRLRHAALRKRRRRCFRVSLSHRHGVRFLNVVMRVNFDCIPACSSVALAKTLLTAELQQQTAHFKFQEEPLSVTGQRTRVRGSNAAGHKA